MNYAELRASIARKGITNRHLAEALGISEQSLYNKMQGIREFKNSEIKHISKILGLSMRDVNIIFFDKSVN